MQNIKYCKRCTIKQVIVWVSEKPRAEGGHEVALGLASFCIISQTWEESIKGLLQSKHFQFIPWPAYETSIRVWLIHNFYSYTYNPSGKQDHYVWNETQDILQGKEGNWSMQLLCMNIIPNLCARLQKKSNRELNTSLKEEESSSVCTTIVKTKYYTHKFYNEPCLLRCSVQKWIFHFTVFHSSVKILRLRMIDDVCKTSECEDFYVLIVYI